MIVGVGELLWDVYPDGRKAAGGAPFNFAFHCHQLGHQAAIVSRVGDDDLGRELRETVSSLGLSDEWIQTDREHPTGAVIVSLDAEKTPRYAIAESVAWDFIEWSPALERLARSDGHSNHGPRADALCFGTLAQRGPASRRTIRRLLESVGPALRIFDINLRQSYFTREAIEHGLHAANWAKISLEEAGAIARTLALADGDARTLALTFRRQFDLEALVMTCGKDGYKLATPGEVEESPAVPCRVVDTVGAGDAFTAAMACLRLEGRPLRECAHFANHYAARVCEQQGATGRIDRAEVERAAFGQP